MAGEIKFKFTDYHDGEGVKEVVLEQGEGVKPAAVSIENGSAKNTGKTLDELIATAKKIEVKSEDETPLENSIADREINHAEADVEVEKKYKVAVEYLFAKLKEKVASYGAGKHDLALKILGEIKEILDKGKFEEGLVELKKKNPSEAAKQEFNAEFDILSKDILDRGSDSQKIAVRFLLDECAEILGIEKEKQVSEEIKKEAQAKIETESEVENQELDERKEELEKIFAEIEFPVESPLRKVSLRNAKWENGALGKLKNEFLEKIKNDNLIQKKDLKKLFFAYCIENIKKVSSNERIQEAILTACGDIAPEEKFDEIFKEIDSVRDVYENKIKFRKEYNSYGEKSKEIELNQKSILNAAYEKGTFITDLYIWGGRSNSLLKKLSEYMEYMKNLSNELFSEVIEKKVEKRGDKNSIERCIEHVDKIKKYRLEAIEDKKNIKDIEFDQIYQKQLSGEEIKRLKEYVKVANDELRNAREKNNIKKDITKDLKSAEISSKEVSDDQTDTAIETKEEDIQVSKDVPVIQANASPETNNQDVLEDFEGESAGEYEEIVDNHAATEKMPELKKEDQEIFIREANETAKYLIAEYEKAGVFGADVSDAMKFEYIRPKVMLVYFELLKEYEFSSERAEEYAKEISNRISI